MSIEKHQNTPRKTETTNEPALWSSLQNKDSKENLAGAMLDAMKKIKFEPNTYYLESTSAGVSVKNKTDNSIIYFTDVPTEVDVLIKTLGFDPSPLPPNQLN